MRIVLILVAVLAFLIALWGPPLMVARKFWLRENPWAFRNLRFVLPAQLITAVVLAFAAEFSGLRNPAAIMAGTTVMVGLLGAGLLALLAVWGARR
ncbi:hypothetical protein SAMN05192549_105444 [Duganella sacchari]|uniref:Uncharacterized protein n=1 Tax=Duganella sacchari TaxID=551987 RepID=A0A1M7PV11_9BURK|nr:MULTISPECIES: hypothetical protein [Duganella]MYM30927.1 hypothetical protein [Duganella sp. CY15W]SHN21333.1 hypothetical protein SAMN05192549_105444 [Duganella sacchari]